MEMKQLLWQARLEPKPKVDVALQCLVQKRKQMSSQVKMVKQVKEENWVPSLPWSGNHRSSVLPLTLEEGEMQGQHLRCMMKKMQYMTSQVKMVKQMKAAPSLPWSGNHRSSVLPLILEEGEMQGQQQVQLVPRLSEQGERHQLLLHQLRMGEEKNHVLPLQPVEHPEVPLEGEGWKPPLPLSGVEWRTLLPLTRGEGELLAGQQTQLVPLLTEEKEEEHLPHPLPLHHLRLGEEENQVLPLLPVEDPEVP